VAGFEPFFRYVWNLKLPNCQIFKKNKFKIIIPKRWRYPLDTLLLYRFLTIISIYQAMFDYNFIPFLCKLKHDFLTILFTFSMEMKSKLKRLFNSIIRPLHSGKNDWDAIKVIFLLDFFGFELPWDFFSCINNLKNNAYINMLVKIWLIYWAVKCLRPQIISRQTCRRISKRWKYKCTYKVKASYWRWKKPINSSII
jgi:hypothetical protein